MKFESEIDKFVDLINRYEVKMIMVGGGAVNFHGYQRSSADVDFWIDNRPENLEKLIIVLQELGYDTNEFPEKVKKSLQNISLKFSYNIDIELITNSSINKSFDEAYKDAEIVTKNGRKILYWRVLSYDDLITSKIKSGRPKDLLDIEELERIKKKNK